jgi:putative CRISPR-associated protein (TIGR02619 family)
MNPALCVVTTIGTSLLSNLAGQGDAAVLREASNLAEEELSPGQRRTIEEITAKARDALGEADLDKGRLLRACAELEGLHALCGDRLTTDEGRYDLHYLIATDTALGHRIGELIASSLREMGRNVELVVPVGLSTRSQASFIAGLRRVVRWCESTLVGQRETGRRVVFHLSGGFKSLLGALNLVGMFYADEVAYRFEGPGAPLIRNPSLPLAARLDLSAPELGLLAVLAECDGLSVRAERVAGWPAALVDTNGHGQASISPWGLLAWYDNKRQVFEAGLLPFPGLRIEPAFENEARALLTADERAALQETLARLAGGLLDHPAGTAIAPSTEHIGFRAGWFIRCVPSDEGLIVLKLEDGRECWPDGHETSGRS